MPSTDRTPDDRVQDDERARTSGLSAITRAESLVRVLDGGRQVSVADLALSLATPPTTTYRLVRQLLEAGWVEQGTERGTYRLGPYFLKIAARMESRMDVRDAARPRMRDLVEQTGCASTLLVERAGRAVCVEREVPVPANTLTPRIGDSSPLHRGAGPLLLLASLPNPGREDLGALVAAVRWDGVAVDHDTEAGTTSFATPVRNHRAELVAALTLTVVQPERGPAAAEVAALRTAAASISRHLGFQGDS